MGTLTFSNKFQTANFTYESEDAKITGMLRKGDNNELLAIESGMVEKDGTMVGSLYSYTDAEGLKINLSNVSVENLMSVSAAIVECFAELTA